MNSRLRSALFCAIGFLVAGSADLLLADRIRISEQELYILNDHTATIRRPVEDLLERKIEEANARERRTFFLREFRSFSWYEPSLSFRLGLLTQYASDSIILNDWVLDLAREGAAHWNLRHHDAGIILIGRIIDSSFREIESKGIRWRIPLVRDLLNDAHHAQEDLQFRVRIQRLYREFLEGLFPKETHLRARRRWVINNILDRQSSHSLNQYEAKFWVDYLIQHFEDGEKLAIDFGLLGLLTKFDYSRFVNQGCFANLAEAI